MDTRVPALLEMLQSAAPGQLRLTPQTRSILVSLTQGMPLDLDDQGEFLSIAPITAEWRHATYTNCALVWRADGDGLWANCTLLAPLGHVICTFKWEDPS